MSDARHDGMTEMPERRKIIREAAKNTGGVAALARRLGLSRAAIYRWQRVPAERVLEVERETSVSRHDLRPDLYPPWEA